MPRSEHFGRSANKELLRLPRPEVSPAVGGYCRLASTKRDGNSASVVQLEVQQLDGPLAFTDYGFVLEDTGDAERPFKVQELESGHIWWYDAHMLQSVADEQVPQQLRQPPPPDDGDYVTLVPHFKQFSDAARGPLSLLRTENAFGMIVLASGDRFRVRACHPSGERAEWWYDREAVRKVHISYVPEHLRQQLRPGWGDYCVLTSDYAEFGAAAAGPLEEGNLGVVVGVDHLPDTQQGLAQPRYCVRTHYNGLLYRYHEGAVHPVVMQLLHDEKIPPANVKARMEKIMVTLTLLEAPRGSGQVADEAARACVSRVLPGGPTLTELTCQAVTPGRKYWLQANMFCKDDDLMLASFKPVKWDMYAPCGIAGEYRPLRPVDPTLWAPTQRQQQAPDGPTYQHQQRLCPELLSLQACRAHTRHMRWGDSAGGAGTRAYEAWRRKSSGMEWAAGRLADAAGGTGPWYMPFEDQLLGVFEWDSDEAPLVMQPGGVTTVQFLWEVSFADLQQRAQCAAPLHLQTTTNIADITSALTEAASSSTPRQQQLPTVMFEHMTAAGRAGQGGPLCGQATPSPRGNPAMTGRAGSSSSSSAGAGGSCSDDGSNADGSECHQSEMGEEGGEVTGAEVGGGVEQQQQQHRACMEGTCADSQNAGEGQQQQQQQFEENRGVGEEREEGCDAVHGVTGGAAAAAALALALEAAAAVGRSDEAAELQQQGPAGCAERQDCCSATAHHSGSANAIQPEQQQQPQQVGVAGFSPPQLVSAASGDWSFPLLQQANSSVDFPQTADPAAAAAVAGPFSAPTTPLAGAAAASTAALAAAADGHGRRRSSSSSNASAPCGVSSGGGSSPSKGGRHRPRSLSCDGRRRSSSSSSSSGTLTGVAFASLSGSRPSSPVAAAAAAAAAATANVFGPATAAEHESVAAATSGTTAKVSEIAAADDDEVASGSSVQLAASSQSAAEPGTPAAVDASTTAKSATSSNSCEDSSGASGSHTETLAAILSSTIGATAGRSSSSSSSSSSCSQTAAADGPSNNRPGVGASSSSTSGSSPAAAATGAAAVVPEVRRPRSMPPILPVLGPSSISSRDSTSGSERSARRSSTATAGGSSRAARPSSSSSRQAGLAASGSSSGARGGSSTGRRRSSSSSSSAPVSRQGSGTVHMPNSGSSTPTSGSSRAATPRGSVTPTEQQQQQQVALGPGMTSISEVMSQLERQAESRQPFWREGTEGAADLAAKAYDAAVEWHQAWRRPGKL